MMKKSFYGLVVCLSMFAVVLFSGEASAVSCNTNADCADDTLFCTGIESCSSPSSICESSGDPCAVGEFCNDVTNQCDECQVAATCDDGLFCNGVETCGDGVCVHPGNPCTGATPVCVEEGTGTCEAAPACTVDANCDDGQFCNGVEICDAGVCVAGPGDPCPVGETCIEDTNTCEIAEGGSLKIDKATVKAGKTAGKDSIQLSGLLNASQDNLNAAGGTVTISLMAVHIPGSGVIEYTFPIDAENIKKGKYTSPKPAVKADPVTSLAIDTNKGTIKFSAKNDDLTGLSCLPTMTVLVEIGAYAAEQELGEDIVNGTKPCPLSLLMGVYDSLDVTDVKAKKSEKPDSDSVSISGTFTIDGLFDTLQPVIIKIGSNTFTVAGAEFVEKNGAYSCKSAETEEAAGLVTATFDSVKATYKISIQNATLSSGGAFSIDLFGNLLNATDPVTVP